jgi:hypothetical protein
MDKDPTNYVQIGLYGFEAHGSGPLGVGAVALVAVVFIVWGFRVWKRWLP